MSRITNLAGKAVPKILRGHEDEADLFAHIDSDPDPDGDEGDDALHAEDAGPMAEASAPQAENGTIESRL